MVTEGGTGVQENPAMEDGSEPAEQDLAGEEDRSQGRAAQREQYALEISGVVTDLWDERLEGWQLERLPDNNTRIVGYVRYQSELYGVLAALRNMGLTLLRVELITKPTQEEGVIL